jgi:hypothetical protein
MNSLHLCRHHFTRVRRRLTRFDALLLACRALDTYSDALVLGNLVFFLAEVLGASDLLTGVVLGLFDMTIRVYFAAQAGRLQDAWPRGRVMALTVMTKFVAAFVTFALLAVAGLVGDRTLALAIVAAVLCVGFAATEAYSGLVYVKAIQVVGADRPEVVTAFMYAADGGVANLAACLARLTMLAVRVLLAPRYALADIVLVSAGAVALAASGALALVVDLHIFRAAAVDDKRRATLPPTPPLGFSWPQLWRYVRFLITCMGVDFLYEQLAIVLPKYLVRHHGLTSVYPAFMAINPFIIFFVGPLLTFATTDRSLLTLMAVGTGIISVAAAFIGVAGWWLIPIALVAITVGEAIGLSQINTYVTREVVSADEIGRYGAICAVPRGLVSMGFSSLSGVLLERFCPAAGACDGGLQLWLIVAGASLWTPILATAQVFITGR